MPITQSMHWGQSMCSRKTLLLVAIVFAWLSVASAQVAKVDRIGIGGASPGPTSSVAITPAGVPTNTAGQTLLFLDASGWLRKGNLAKADLPATTVFTDQANTFGAFLQQFGGGVTITGANDLVLGTGGVRVASGSILLRNIADSANIATFGDSAIALNQPTTITGNTSITGTVGVSALSTFTGGFNSNAASSVAANLSITGANDLIVGTGGIRAGSGDVLIRNVADTTTSAAIGDSAIALNRDTTINGAATVTGLTTLAQVLSTGYRGVSDPFTVYDSALGSTALLRAYDNGRAWIGNTGTNAYWEYNATGNASGSRNWRAGIVGGNFRFEAGNDAGSSWSTLFRSTATASVANGLYFGPAVRQVGPDQDFTTDLGSFPSQFANLWIRNLWATTLVAQDVISTIGGAVLVTPTTKLEAAVTGSATTFLTTHNEMAANDVAYIQDNLQTEFVQVTAGPRAGSSSISFVGENEAVATTVTLPTHQAGDLLLVFAFRNAATAPSLPAGGWVSLCTASGGSTSVRVGYLIAAGAGTASGTWTNATSVMSHVYRSSAGNMPAPGACTHDNGAASTSLVYPSISLTKSDHSSWVARAAMSSAGTNIQTAPTGYTLRSNNTAVPESASFDSNGRITATSVAASSALTISSANWRSVSVEIVGIGLAPYSYDVTRGYGGAFAARAWPGGVALANTGAIGDGGINMYAIQSIKGSGEQGPTIQGYERTSLTYNALATRWALGNMRGLFDYGATTVWGAAFGNPADVWLGIDTTNGVRFMEGGTTQTARFALDGSILLGQPGAGQANTYIDPGVVALRWGTNPLISLSSPGVQMFDNSAVRRIFLERTTGNIQLGTDGTGEENLLITPTYAAFRVAGTVLMQLDGTAGISVNDMAGVPRVAVNSTSGVIVGRNATGHSNIWLNTAGDLLLRYGSAVRMGLTASDSTFRIYDDDGTTTRFLVNTAGIAMYDQASKPYFYLDTSNGVLIGDWTTTNNPFLQLTGSTLQFCRGNGGPCTLQFAGATGNITSTGSILLSTGGNVTSTGNFSLTQNDGLNFVAAASSYSAAKAVSWGTAGSPDAAIWGHATGQDTLMMNAGTSYLSLQTLSSVQTLIIGQNAVSSQNVTFRAPDATGTSSLGTSSIAWDNVYGSQYYSGASAGFSGTLTIGSCSLNFAGGLYINATGIC